MKTKKELFSTEKMKRIGFFEMHSAQYALKFHFHMKYPEADFFAPSVEIEFDGM